MGLDAVVYLRSARVKDSRMRADNYNELSAETPAIHKRLGNASMIAWIARQDQTKADLIFTASRQD
jgi:hypothetical protein